MLLFSELFPLATEDQCLNAQRFAGEGHLVLPLGGEKRPLKPWLGTGVLKKGKGWEGGTTRFELFCSPLCKGVGIALGGLSGEAEERYVCFDGDSPGGVAAVERMAKACGVDGPRVASSPGKQHLYLQVIPGVKIKGGRSWYAIGTGSLREPEVRTDLRADGNYACLPGTLHPKGHRYAGIPFEGVESEPGSGEEGIKWFDKEYGQSTEVYKILYRLASFPAKSNPDQSVPRKDLVPRLMVRRLATARAALNKIGAETETLVRQAAREGGWEERLEEFDREETLNEARRAEKAECHELKQKIERIRLTAGPEAAGRELAAANLAALVEECREAVPGTCNETAYQAGRRAGEFGLSLDNTIDALTPAFHDCDPGDEDHNMETVKRGWLSVQRLSAKEMKFPSFPKLRLLEVIPFLPRREKMLCRCHKCGRIAARSTVEQTGELLMKTDFKCNHPVICSECAEEQARYAEASLLEECRERGVPGVTELSALSYGSLLAEFETRGLEKPTVFQAAPGEPLFGASPDPKGESFVSWAKRWAQRTRESSRKIAAALRAGNVVEATNLVEKYAGKNWHRFKPGSLPTGFTKKEFARGKEIMLGRREPPRELKPGETAITTYYLKETGQILKTVPYVATPQDIAEVVDETPTSLFT